MSARESPLVIRKDTFIRRRALELLASQPLGAQTDPPAGGVAS